MNWSRGLFRAWMAFTALWLVVCGTILVGDWPAEPSDVKEARLLPPPPPGYEVVKDPFLAEAKVRHQRRVKAHMERSAYLTAAPPIMLLVAGAAGLWVARGFKR